ncbi:ShlB/FhaC/HecB family hemolysin secretion/activation protein [Kordiimonas aestuarii]|uniref:ShlB/FhaC/HecB family hemolysin secretion/activation protein n=1 Tax=Kordiimonas aestuarii TaxID=1005925 RepID=UPI0021D150B4|nr:ShlB/FhaC/HecB family hemolysin secretion/activation protein [Kordiimonas aestuarii]
MAQETPPDIPDPSKLEEQFEEREVPESSIVIREPADARQQTVPKTNVRFVLTKLKVSGNTTVSISELTRFYQSHLGEEISLTRIYDIAAQMTAYYRNKGFILTRVVVPAQEIEDGFVTLQVVEGYIDQVTIDGEFSHGRRLLTRLGARIKASVPLRAVDLERYMLLANDLPGLRAQAVLQSSSKPGATDLTILVTEDRAYAYATVNNRGSKFNGPVQVQVGATFNSVLGSMSKTSLRLIGASQLSEFRSGEIRHEQVLGAEGTVMTLVARHTRSEPGASLAELEIESRSTSGSFTLAHPVIRSRAKSLYIHAGLDIRNTRTTILEEEFTTDRVRKAVAGASYDFVDNLNGINLISTEVSKGLNILNGKETGEPGMSRADAESDFIKFNMSLMRLQKIASRVSLLLDVTAQYTNDALVASEEMVIGGSQYGRAFDPSEISGERGIAGRAELRYDGTTTLKWLQRYQVYGFTDYGAVWDHRDTGYVSTDLGSAGGGVRLTLNRNLSANFELATPIKKTDDYDERWSGAVRGFFSLSLRF